jgi:threonine efflux protein
MDILLSVFFILSALLAGAMSPGPSFVLIARISMGTSRNDGIAASIGMGIGGVIFSLLALMGLQTILTNIPVLYIGLKVFGGLYLIYIAIRIWRGANQPLKIIDNSINGSSTMTKSFLIGLGTQISNPKAAIVYSGIFAALLPTNIPQTIYYILPPLVFIVEAGWYMVVTLLLSSKSPRTIYLKSKSVLDRVAGGVMAGLGVKLISNAGGGH